MEKAITAQIQKYRNTYISIIKGKRREVSMDIKQITTNAGNMVLCDVQWSNAESRGYGACKNYTVHLEPFSNTL